MAVEGPWLDARMHECCAVRVVTGVVVVFAAGCYVARCGVRLWPVAVSQQESGRERYSEEEDIAVSFAPMVLQRDAVSVEAMGAMH